MVGGIVSSINHSKHMSKNSKKENLRKSSCSILKGLSTNLTLGVTAQMYTCISIYTNIILGKCTLQSHKAWILGQFYTNSWPTTKMTELELFADDKVIMARTSTT